MDEFKFDVFTKGTVANIPVVIQKAHTRLYEKKKNFKYAISSECQVISTSTKKMIDLCSRMKKCTESLSNIKESLSNINDDTLKIASPSHQSVQIDIFFSMRWIQNLSFRSYKLIKDKKFIECFKLIFIEAAQMFNNLRTTAIENPDLLNELENHEHFYINSLIPNLFNKSSAQLMSLASDLTEITDLLLVLIAIGVYTGTKMDSVRNLIIDCRNRLIEKATNIDQFLSVLHINNIGLPLSSMKITKANSENQAEFFNSIKLFHYKNMPPEFLWPEFLNDKFHFLLQNSSDHHKINLIYQIISYFETNSLEAQIEYLKTASTQLLLELDLDTYYKDETQSDFIKMISNEVPLMINKWLDQTFSDNRDIASWFSEFSTALNTIDKCLTKMGNTEILKIELSKRLPCGSPSRSPPVRALSPDPIRETESEVHPEERSDLGEGFIPRQISEDNITNNGSSPEEQNTNMEVGTSPTSKDGVGGTWESLPQGTLDSLASMYCLSEDSLYRKYLDDNIIEVCKDMANSIFDSIQSSCNAEVKEFDCSGISFNTFNILFNVSQYILSYIDDSGGTFKLGGQDHELSVMKTLIGYNAFKPISVKTLQDAIDSEYMAMKYKEFRENGLTSQILEKLNLPDIEFDLTHSYPEAKKLAGKFNMSTMYMFSGISCPSS